MALPSSPEISVVVPVRNGASALPELLRSLGAQSLHSAEYEVIVVDNGSTDETAAIARSRGAIVVSEGQPSRSRARNRGVETARADLLAFTDVDCIAEPTWLEALVSALGAAPLVAGAVEVTTTPEPGLVERLDVLWRFRDQERRVREDHWTQTANLGVTRAAFDTVGGFDPSFWARGEDVDFCLRARDAGLELAWCPAAVVDHRADAELRVMLRRALSLGYSSTQHHRRSAGRIGSRYWRHPGPLVRGDFALRRFGNHLDELDPTERKRLLRLAKVEFGARLAGSAWAELTRAR